MLVQKTLCFNVLVDINPICVMFLGINGLSFSASISVAV